MKYFGLVIFIFISYQGVAQTNSELPFIEHLVNKGYYQEAIHFVKNDTGKYNQNQRDSINYYLGWAHYSIKELEQSTNAFLDVRDESAFYLKSRFFAGYNQTYLGNYTRSRKIVSQIKAQDERILSLAIFELSGIDLLQGDWTKAKMQLEKINPSIASMSQQVQELIQLCKIQESHHPKSPFLAGLMSAIIPGSGKIYAGKTGEGIASLIANVGFGLITLENYRKSGSTSFKTIFFGSILAATYISNIYGSVLSVKIIENEYKRTIHNQILFQLHIPLRNFF